ncbi:MAG: MBOAT family protein [Clostridia bacterium]|nr:MBOAT family protein [Clostridia bacterium]
MLFSSIPFLYYFLPAVLILYFLAPKVLKNSVLLLSSLFFYGWGEPVYLILMVTTILVVYICGLIVEATRGKLLSKLTLIFSVLFGIGLLGYFKYADFFVSNFNAVTGLSLPLLNIALPIGISFYTFQTMSYVVDVYRGDVKAQKNPVTLGMYVSMFPQLIAGPIVRYSDIVAEINDRKHSFEDISSGIARFITGLSKKVLIANLLGELCDIFRASNEKSVLFFWMYAIGFSLHIYFDFSGYSDMAIGLGKIFGFHFIENFNYPYISKTVSEFWRRWHMSLGSWFRDYVYIPLGGNRVSFVRWIFNILVVWMLTGFWHGAAWNFVIWGLMFAALLLFERGFFKKKNGNILKNILSHIYVLFFVMISFVLFNATDLKEAYLYITALFGAADYPLINTETVYYLKSYAVIFIIAIAGSTPLAVTLYRKLKANNRAEKILNIFEPVVLTALLTVITAFLVDGSFNPFLYFRF